MKTTPITTASYNLCESAHDLHAARDRLLHGLRATGTGIDVLAIDDEEFFDKIKFNLEFRTKMIEILKLMYVQVGYDEYCASLAEKAREKIMAALVGSCGIGIMKSLAQPVNMDLIPKMGKINAAYINQLKPEWNGPITTS